MGVLGTNFTDLWAYHCHAVTLPGVACVVIVMVFFSDGEMKWLFDGGDDVCIKKRLHLLNHFSGDVALFGCCWHDAASVLRADVVALAVELGGIMNGEEDF